MSFADKVSSIRIVLIPVFVSFLIYSHTKPALRYAALGVFILAVLSDFFDGLVARIKKEKSELGKLIDPLADKLLLLTSFITLYLLNDFHIPLWVVLVVASRDAILLTGFFVFSFLKIPVVIEPSVWGKFTTFFQMLTVLIVLCDNRLMVAPYIWTVTVVFTLISGVDYCIKGVVALNGHNTVTD